MTIAIKGGTTMAETTEKERQPSKKTVQIEFKCEHCGANNTGKFVLFTAENMKSAIDRYNANSQKMLEKYQHQSGIMDRMPEESCKYVRCQVCDVPNYPFGK
jgi:hypothetical protein